MQDFPTGHQIYLALVKILEVSGIADAPAAVDVTLVPENHSATYTIVPTETAKPVLASALSRLLGRPFAMEDASWALELDETAEVLKAGGF